MRLLAWSRSLAAKFLHGSETAHEMEEELRSHIQLRADDLERSGLARAEAERRARIEFGGREKYKEECHQALGGNFIETLIQDVRFCLRTLRKSPGFAVAAVLTLALAIGANAVVFGVMNALILRPLNVPQSQSLYAIERGHDQAINHSYPDYLDLNDRNRSFDGLAAYGLGAAGLDTGKDLSGAWIQEVTTNYFDVLRIHPFLGRFFHAENDAPRAAVVNQEFARKIFGSAANALGGHYKRRDGTRIQVVGVAEDGKYASLTEDPQPAMFLPILQSPTSLTTLVVRSNRDPQQLTAAITRTVRSVDEGLPITIFTWNQELNDAARFASRMATMTLGVMGLMGALLSIVGIFGMAAFSVSKRLRELGLRIALGAQRTEVLHAALGRALKLLAVGSAAGLLLGLLATRVLAYIVYQATPRDPLVLTGVVLVMLVLGLLATWIPAQRALSVDPLILLREE
jgi:ABC-type antimicrobial peptide transport system permease subunit